jgi:anti-sigma B factor antagonist
MKLAIMLHNDADGTIRLVVAGELDHTTAEQLTTAVRHAAAGREINALVIDLDGLTFLDSSGMAALVQTHTFTTGTGAGYWVTNARGTVHRTLERVGLLPYLTGRSEA